MGYDLAGIRATAVRRFLARDDATRRPPWTAAAEIPARSGRLRDLAFPTRRRRTLTLRTFHGCPPDEIEAIPRFLMSELGLTAS